MPTFESCSIETLLFQIQRGPGMVSNRREHYWCGEEGGQERNQRHWELNKYPFHHKGYLICISRLVGWVRKKFTIKVRMIVHRSIIVRR